MLEHFAISFSVVFPLFLWMAAGFLAKRWLFLDETWALATNKVFFRLLMPTLLFTNMVNSDLSVIAREETLWLIGYIFVGLLLTFLFLMVTVPRIDPQNSRRGVLVQGTLRSNIALFGIPMALSLYGEGNIAMMAIAASAAVPLMNMLSVVALEYFQGHRVDGLHMVKSILTNPMIIGISAGILVNVCNIPYPQSVQKAVEAFAGCATPMAFFVLGVSFSLRSAVQNRKAITFSLLMRLAFIPAVWIGLAAFVLGMRGQALLAVLAVFAPSTAVGSYPMACAMGGDEHLSSEIVVLSSGVSILSVFLWVLLLKMLGML